MRLDCRCHGFISRKGWSITSVTPRSIITSLATAVVCHLLGRAKSLPRVVLPLSTEQLAQPKVCMLVSNYCLNWSCMHAR